MKTELKCPTCGGNTVEPRSAGERLAEYLTRETGASAADAERRANDIVMLLGGGSGIVTLAPIAALATRWWLFALRGVLAILFGVLALAHPLAALSAVVLLFGVWAFIDGVNALALAASGWRSWQLALAGVLGIVLGIVTLLRPDIAAVGLYAAIAAWSIARGILEIVVGIELRRRVAGERWLVLGGVASIVFGIVMIALPAVGVRALAWLIGLYALAFGAIMLALGLRLRRVGRAPARHEPPLRAPPTLQPA